MRFLVDTDIFCKLAAVGLLDDVVRHLGGTSPSLERLPALPQMLKRGGLYKKLGPEVAARLLKLAEPMPEIPPAPEAQLAQLTQVPQIDPGEAQLFAVAAATADVILLSGDKRALRAVASVPGFGAALSGKVVTLEAALLVVCLHLGDDAVRQAVAGHYATDRVFSICFSSGNSSPQDCLRSYLQGLQGEVEPLKLWLPTGGAA